MKAERISLYGNPIRCEELSCGVHLYQTAFHLGHENYEEYFIEVNRRERDCWVSVWKCFKASNGSYASYLEPRCEYAKAQLGVRARITCSMVLDFRTIADALQCVEWHCCYDDLGLRIERPESRY